MIAGTVPTGYAGPATPMTIWTTQRTGGRNTTCPYEPAGPVGHGQM